MSEFKFFCPNCNQKILADTGHGGVKITCPTCQHAIAIPDTVPGAPAPPPLPQTASRPAPAVPVIPLDPPRPPDHFSALAAASLICSLFVPLGSIAGVVCGHLAKRRMRKDFFLVGERTANAGLLISYCLLVAMLSVAGLFFYQHLYYRPLKVLRESPAALAALQPRVVDEVLIGENEDDHAIDWMRNSQTILNGKYYRNAPRGGSFGYLMKVLPQGAMTLDCRYLGSTRKAHIFDIAVDDQIIATQDLTAVEPGHFFDMEYKIPDALTRGKTEVKVEFQAHPGKTAGDLYGCLILKR